MATVNKVILVGNLGLAPEIRHMPSGEAVCTLSVSTSETWKDKTTGERKEATEWHKVVLFGRLAEVADQYLYKGASVYIEGSLRARKWTDRGGVERYSTEIRADTMKMLGGRQDGEGHPQQRQAAPQRQQAPQQQYSSGFDDMDSDIPF